MTVVDEVRERVDIGDVIAPYVALQKSGANLKGRCPFHDEKTPSFYVYPSSWDYHCFGCGAHGDGYKFLMDKEGLSFADSLRRLATIAGIEVPDRMPDQQASARKSRLQEMHEAASTFFAQALVRPDGAKAREYLTRRGLSRTTIETFGLGFAPEGWESLLRFLNSRGYEADEVVAGGLAIARESGGQYDRFRNRVVIPIRDREGRTIAFGARTLGDDQPKYLNSPETPLFSKGSVLFALDRAAKPIRDQDRAVIVEGYLDVISAHQAGFANVVAPLGTALTENQVRILTRLTKRVVLALDADAAGRKATLRSLEVFQAAQESPDEIGAIPWEGYARSLARQSDLDLRVLTLPDGRDPDDVIRAEPELWRRLVDEAAPFVDHLFRTVLADVSADDPSAKTRAADALLPTINQLDPIQRSVYLDRLANALAISTTSLVERGQELARRGPRGPAAGGHLVGVGDRGTDNGRSGVRLASSATNRSARTAPDLALEHYVLALFFRFPELQPSEFGLRPEHFAGLVERQLLNMPNSDDPVLADARMHILGGGSPPIESADLARRSVAQAAKRLQVRFHQRLIRSGGAAAETPDQLASVADEGDRLLAVWKSRELEGS